MFFVPNWINICPREKGIKILLNIYLKLVKILELYSSPLGGIKILK